MTFDPLDVGWIDDTQAALELLTDGDLEPLGYLSAASNTTLLCRVGPEEDRIHAVYKPRDGERPLWDFPRGSLAAREVAAYRVSAFLGWDLVPPTVLRDGPLGEGSVQLFVPHDPRQHYFTLVEQDQHALPLVLLAYFDLLTNNADRKGGHVLLGARDGRVYGIDNGLTFHTERKLRTVVWDLGAAPLQPMWRADLRRLAATLEGGGAEAVCLDGLLAPEEIAVLCARARRLRDLERLPVAPQDRRPYPWPPV